ncbi:VCBS repeat-containing protein [Mucilaginibacter sp. 21P]|uniref:FG-GAP repeat domain-containing protein n=1 Tax=Mucilaginibacter sp. 21P TaxID=2778902 RepID=UPI001C59E4BE|nr:VCBS repeat-containing protein [Mucilaginibacter sp. 21P]QXV66745.1 VCBS repeat-containing protein [Mucilaginibacter sp. 21P]
MGGRLTKVLFSSLYLGVALVGFNSFTVKKSVTIKDDGKGLFTTYCAICHMLPNPASLTKNIWQLHVLPVMASRMGIIYPNYDPLKGLSEEERKIVNKNAIIPENPMLTDKQWDQLKNYILKNAPDSIPLDRSRLTRDSKLTQFVRNDVQVDEQLPSLITGLKYDKDTKKLWIGSYYNKVLTWQPRIGVVDIIPTKSPVVDFSFYKGDVYFTQIGKLYPTELSTGQITKNDGSSVLAGALHRPVNTAVEDLNNDGTPEIVVCNFGNKLGSLSLFKKDKKGKYKEDVLLPQAGAIKCYVQDMNGDGKKDIVAMFSQGDESVYIFYQTDNLKFKAKRVLRFPPNYGTTDMVLTDYNRDGLTDIITVHGDNADYSNILKPYHGVRININEGNSVFAEKFFYPIHGVTRVLAEDFDKDGDIDLAASAFFPDMGPLVDESFVYLENMNSAKYNFKAYNLKSDVPLKSLTLEKADIDGDGDVDIIAGNFAQSPGAAPPELDKKWKAATYGLIIYLNTLKK